MTENISIKNAMKMITPEKAGISSEAVIRFIDKISDKRLCLHSVIMLRHGDILAEGYYKPLKPDMLHRMYSTSKSFLSVAVGILAGEGKVSLDDSIVKYFPDKVKAGEAHPLLKRTTIRDMLMMADSHNEQTYNYDDRDFIATYFDKLPKRIPGKIFQYNTACTTTLAAMVERVAGMPVLEYLRPRLLDPIGFSKEAWCIKTPCGYSACGTGVMCTARDLARFALVCMNRGMWDGRQLIPENYITAATSYQIDNSMTNSDSEHQFGYGYQFWMTRHNGFACRGMGSQLAVCLPDKDFILVTTGDTQIAESEASFIYEALWNTIYPHLEAAAGTLREDRAAHNMLQKRLDTLEIPVASPGNPVAAGRIKNIGAISGSISGKKYVMNNSATKIESMKFTFGREIAGNTAGDTGRLEYVNNTGAHMLEFGFGRHIEQEFPETHYYGKVLGTPSGKGYRTYGSASWINEKDLILQFYLADDYFGTLKMQVCFSEDSITVYMKKAAQWFLNEYQGFLSGNAV